MLWGIDTVVIGYVYLTDLQLLMVYGIYWIKGILGVSMLFPALCLALIRRIYWIYESLGVSMLFPGIDTDYLRFREYGFSGG